MNIDKDVVILLATYNGEKYLSSQLDSILGQSYSQYSLIIHDDNSSDSTLDIIESYAKKYPDKIQFINDSKGFNNSLLNFSFLLEDVDAEYIMFCDQDDIWLEDKLEKSLAKMKKEEKQKPNTPLLLHTDLTVVDENLKVLDESYMKYQHLDPSLNALSRLLMQNVVTGCTLMINKALLPYCKAMPEAAIAHDWWIALVASCFGELIYLDEATMLYRQHENNQVGAQAFNFNEMTLKANTLSTLSLEKYYLQAQALLDKHDRQLPVDKKKILQDFLKIKKQYWLKSKYSLFKQGFLKQGVQRNIGLLLCK